MQPVHAHEYHFAAEIHEDGWERRRTTALVPVVERAQTAGVWT